MWYSGSVTNQKIVTMSTAEQTINDVSLTKINHGWNGNFCYSVWLIVCCLKMKYTEEYEQSKAKGSFPAMITPGYQAAKQANSLASNVRHPDRNWNKQGLTQAQPRIVVLVFSLCLLSWNTKKGTRKEFQSTPRLLTPLRWFWPKNKAKLSAT